MGERESLIKQHMQVESMKPIPAQSQGPIVGVPSQNVPSTTIQGS